MLPGKLLQLRKELLLANGKRVCILSNVTHQNTMKNLNAMTYNLFRGMALGCFAISALTSNEQIALIAVGLFFYGFAETMLKPSDKS